MSLIALLSTCLAAAGWYTLRPIRSENDLSALLVVPFDSDRR